MGATEFVNRVAEEASNVRLGRVIITVLSAPFWLLGVIAGLLLLLLRYAYGAAVIGFGDAQRALTRPRPELSDAGTDDKGS